MITAHPSQEKAYQKYAWVILFVLGLIIALFGLGDIPMGGSSFESGEGPTLQGITGLTWQELRAESPHAAAMLDYLVRAGGANLLVLGLFGMAVSWTGFRRGERWAWYAMWLWPVWFALVVLLLMSVYKLPGPGVPPPFVSGPVFLILSVLALLLPYRKFFPKQS